ncbi:MAG: tRNA (guanosine(46)-N7)-methyltransferase TrmB [Candidatus Flexifilum sp.]|jgi:tRNA (guanine-N7-)-methyltransferase
MTSASAIRRLSALTLPGPLDRAALFGPERASLPLILEIGFGRGTFLLHLAQSYPDHNVLGIEVSNRCLDAAERVIARLGLPNVRVIHGRAEMVLHHLIEPESLVQVHINFPDPWFKTSHSHRRLMQRDTLDAIISRLRPGGLLYLATDIRAYAEMSAELLEASPALINQLPGRWAASLPGRVTTKYEARAEVEGRPCYYFCYRRGTDAVPDVPLIKDAPMPHLVFRTPLSLDDIHARFAPLRTQDGTTAIHVGECYRARHNRALMFELHLAEPTIEQHTALLLNERLRVDDLPAGLHEYSLQLTTLGHPRPTDGMHLAVQHLGDWLLSLHPQAHIVIAKVAVQKQAERKKRTGRGSPSGRGTRAPD